MRRLARLSSIVSVCCGFLALGLLAQPICLLLAPATRRHYAARGLQACARVLLWLLGVKIKADGFTRALAHRPYLLVSNHQSYLDIIIIAAIFPTLFVAKREVGRWPLLGWLAQLCGTIFIKRQDARSNVRGAYLASRSLRAGTSVQVFPEGTTSDGTTVLPFHSLFFAAAFRARTPVLPLTIRFEQVDGSQVDEAARESLCWYGAMNFAPHFWRLLQVKSVEVTLIIHGPIKPTRGMTARTLAAAAQQQVCDGFINEAAPSHADAPDFIVGAVLYSLFASNQNELVKELLPEGERS